MSGAKLSRILLAALALAAGIAHAGGPLSLCNVNTPSGTPITYANPNVLLNYDKGTLGTLSNAQAATLVNNAIALWTNVPTATISLTRGADVPVDVTTANVLTYYDYNNSIPLAPDGLNPVIYDNDGSIIDLIMGTGANNSVLGFAGSFWSGCHYLEGQAVINGKFSADTALMTTVMAHELGHFIGLDHTDLNAAQGLSSANYPLMYPVAYRSSISLGDDDVSAITSLYPDTNVAASYGTLQGNFRTTGGTQVPGANIWAKENTSGKVYSVVSDYLTQRNGFFKMLLPPGTYTLHASALDATDPGSGVVLTGGSGVGPYSGGITDASFQPPLYASANAGGAPLNIVFGNSTPNQVVITAGCVATADFRINGTGSLSGNCVAGPPPPPSDARLANLSTRMQVLTGNNVMIGGFIIGGSSNKTVAITATGPSLAAFGITNPLANPTLMLVRSSDQSVVATNDDWQTDANAALLQASGFAPSDPREPGLYINLAPGAYTAIVSGVGNTLGVSVVGVFEVDHPEIPLINISTRGFVQTGGNVMIGGFVVQGTTSKTLAITATGPSLGAFGITNPLANPTLTIVRSSDQAIIATNDNWQSDANASLLQASGFAPSNPLEPGLLLTLPPGAYTAIVGGVSGATGTSVIGVFATQ